MPRLRFLRVLVPILLSLLVFWGTTQVFAQELDPTFSGDYTCTDLGGVPGLPPSYGGLTFKAGDADTILIGGFANTASGKLYSIGVVRDGSGHITGFTGVATEFAEAAYNDGGVVYGPDGVLFLARWPVIELGQTKPGSAITDKVIDLSLSGVGGGGPGGVMFVPPGFPGAGQLKILTWSAGEWYTLGIAPDGAGTFDVTSATLETTITGGPEGMIYIPPGSPVFGGLGLELLVAEWSAGNIVAYAIDGNGDPIPASRTVFLSGLIGAEGAEIDPVTGDFMFSTFGGGDKVFICEGFVPPPPSGEITLDPPVATNDVGTDHTVTATLVDSVGTPLVGDLVTFSVVSGPNTGAAGTCSVNADCTSDAGGQVSFTYTSDGTPSPPDDVIQASFTDATGVLRLATATKTWEAPPTGDTTPPRCDVVGVVAGDLHVEVEDTGDGLKEINVLVADNATVDVAPFAVGTNDVVLVMGIKIDGGSPATIRIEAIDDSPDMNRSECDPVLVSLSSEDPAVPSRQTFSGIPGADRYVTLYAEGPAFSLVTVNGTWTTVLTKGRAIDIGSGLIDGQDNTVTLWSMGVDGSVMFSDVIPSNATGPTTAYRSSWEDLWAPY